MRSCLQTNQEFTAINPDLLNQIANISSMCSAPCKPGEKKILMDKSCCWTCVKCSGEQQVVAPNGTECELCNEKQTPNQFRNACVSLEEDNLDSGSVYSIIPVVVSSLGIAVTVWIAVIFGRNRNTPIVKASSKELCVFVFVGAIICLLDGYVTIGGLTAESCGASRVALSIGPACMYSGLLTKTIRIVIIFQSKNVLKKHWKAYIRPTPQVISTIVLIVLQFFILALWFLSKPNEVIRARYLHRLHLDCSGINDAQILIGMIYPLVLIIACTVFATINRNVPTGFKETRYVGFTMYTTCVIWLAFVPIVLSNVENVPLRVMTTSICLSLSAITVMAWLFIPRCYDILFRPERNTPQAVMNTNLSRPRSRSSGQNDDLSFGIQVTRKLSTTIDPNFFPISKVYSARQTSIKRPLPVDE